MRFDDEEIACPLVPPRLRPAGADAASPRPEDAEAVARRSCSARRAIGNFTQSSPRRSSNAASPTVEALSAAEELQPYFAWVRRRKPTKHVAVKPAKRKR